MVLPTEKPADATNTYNSNTPNPTQTYQDYAHFQFYLVLCDPNSSTQSVQVACTPNSDSNSQSAGASLLELKFIPPGEPTNAPFSGYNCSNRTTTQWCAIAQIQINTAMCGVPLNEAWITTNGQPPQPVFTFPQTPAGSNTLLMNQGDRIRVILTDSANGLLIVVIDETTHTTGADKRRERLRVPQRGHVRGRPLHLPSVVEHGIMQGSDMWGRSPRL